MSSPLDSLHPDKRALIERAEVNLHQIVRFENLTREQAIEVKKRMCLGIGLLNTRFSLKFDVDTLNVMFQNIKPVDVKRE